MAEAEHVLSIHNLLGEGPLWDPAAQALFWVDVPAGCVHKFVPGTGDSEVHAFEQPISCLVRHASGGLIMAARDGLVHWDQQRWTVCISRESMGIRDRYNDGAVDRAGRLWIGTAGDHPDHDLFRVDRDATFRVMETGLTISNGIAWSPDNRTMYLSDSGGAGVVYAYDFDLAHGTIANRRIFLPPTGTPAVADGLTVDREGGVWVAFWDGWRVERRAPDGSLLQRIDLPVQRPTSCAFGGADLNELYITSASQDTDPAEQPQAGDLFLVRTDVQGLAEPVCEMIVPG